MPLTADDLRVALRIPADDWSIDDDAAAAVVVERALRQARSMVGVHRAARAEADGDEHKLGALDDAALELAKADLANPERALQLRQGSDVSTSWGDSVDAVTLRAVARSILRDAFGDRAVTVKL